MNDEITIEETASGDTAAPVLDKAAVTWRVPRTRLVGNHVRVLGFFVAAALAWAIVELLVPRATLSTLEIPQTASSDSAEAAIADNTTTSFSTTIFSSRKLFIPRVPVAVSYTHLTLPTKRIV